MATGTDYFTKMVTPVPIISRKWPPVPITPVPIGWDYIVSDDLRFDRDIKGWFENPVENVESEGWIFGSTYLEDHQELGVHIQTVNTFGSTASKKHVFSRFLCELKYNLQGGENLRNF